MLRCCMCHRLLTRDPAATVKTRAGWAAYGPKCAASLGLVRYETRAAAPKRTRLAKTANVSPEQMQLDLECHNTPQ